MNAPESDYTSLPSTSKLARSEYKLNKVLSPEAEPWYTKCFEECTKNVEPSCAKEVFLNMIDKAHDVNVTEDCCKQIVKNMGNTCMNFGKECSDILLLSGYLWWLADCEPPKKLGQGEFWSGNSISQKLMSSALSICPNKSSYICIMYFFTARKLCWINTHQLYTITIFKHWETHGFTILKQ